MATSKRHQIIQAIVSRMETVLIVNAYATNLGQSVADWQVEWNEEELPGTSVCDLTEDVSEDTINEGYDFYRLPVQIRTMISSITRTAEARKYMADIIKAVGVDPNWTTLAERTQLKRAGFIMADDGFKVSGIAVEIEISYFTEKFNPFP